MKKQTLQEQCLLELLKLDEATRTQLVAQSRNVGKYKDTSRGVNRMARKKYSKIANAVKAYNAIDMNKVFKQDILQVNIPVVGETDEYTVTIKIEGVIAEIQKNIKNNGNKFEYRTIIQALTKVFNTTDVYTKCTCADYCLHPDTKIKLLDGTTVTVEELEKKVKASSTPVYVYSVDENGDFKPGRVKDVWVSGSVNEMLKITLDNGNSIITTPEHPYMLRNGQYKEAKDLEVGTSLMPLYFGTTKNGYETVKANSKATTEFYSTYKQVANTLLQKGIRNYWANLSDEEREKVILQRKQNLSKGARWNKGKHLSDEDKFNKSQAALNKPQELKDLQAKKIRETKMLKVFNKMLEDNVDLTAENYEKYRSLYFSKSPKLSVLFDDMAEAVRYFKLNHKIVKIETISYDFLQPVYDIEVENYHNFYVDAGVVLHNCYRFKHWNIIKNVSVDDSSQDPGPGKGIVNPNDDKGRGCKHVLLTLSNGEWMMKVASVINNYCHFLSEKKPEAFLKLVFPKLYGVPADEAAENDIVADNEDLETGKDLIDIVNDWAKNRGKFKKGSNINPVYADKLSKEQEKKEKDSEEASDKPVKDEKEESSEETEDKK